MAYAYRGTTELDRRAGRGLELVARIGYAAKGLVYCVVGALALMFAFGESEGELTGGKGAIERLGSQPFGNALLWVTAAGLFCYAVWSTVRAVLNPEQKPRDKGGIASRIGYGLAAISHFSLAIYAGRRAYGAAASQGGGAETVTSEAMSMPLGSVLVAVAGIIAVAFGAYQIYRAIKNRIEEHLQTYAMSRTEQRVAHVVGRLGVLARGIVFPVAGISLVIAAVRTSPSEASDLGESLHKIASGPLGDALLGFVALGLFAYGVYQFFVARYAFIPRRLH